VVRAGGPPFQCWLKPYELWVPRPCVFCKGGYDDVRIMRFSPKSIPALQTLQPTLREERVPRTDSNRSRRCKLVPGSINGRGPISWYRQHRTPPCKKRKSGAPIVLIVPARSKAWATRPFTPRSGQESPVRFTPHRMQPTTPAGWSPSPLELGQSLRLRLS